MAHPASLSSILNAVQIATDQPLPTVRSSQLQLSTQSQRGIACVVARLA
jgi:hypothetical protein